jgi:hypothetical protein
MRRSRSSVVHVTNACSGGQATVKAIWIASAICGSCSGVLGYKTKVSRSFSPHFFEVGANRLYAFILKVIDPPSPLRTLEHETGVLQ